MTASQFNSASYPRWVNSASYPPWVYLASYTRWVNSASYPRWVRHDSTVTSPTRRLLVVLTSHTGDPEYRHTDSVPATVLSSGE